MNDEIERCNCDASCGENRYHDKGSLGCRYYKPPEPPNVQEYFNMLEHHDWSYKYSDDHSVWKRGQSTQEKLEALSRMSILHTHYWAKWLVYGPEHFGPRPLLYLCDKARHMVCKPYSLENLHRMAKELNVNRAWFHKAKFPHYDMPKKRIAELSALCVVITQKEILGIIKTAVDRVMRNLPTKEALNNE